MRRSVSVTICSVWLVLAITFPILAFEDITPQEVKQKMDAGEDIFIMDVRQPEEYAQGYVPKAQLIPLGEVELRLDEISRDKPVIVVCKSGGRSAMASQTLNDNGFTNVFNMVGGTLAWKDMPAYLYIKAQDLADQLAGLDALIVDVRSEAEYAREHIIDAVSIPLDLLGDRRDEIPQGKPIIVVGKDDDQSAAAAAELIALGYQDVKSLEGGMLSWDFATRVSARDKAITTFAAIKILRSDS